MRNIKVKQELQGLKHDLQLGLEQGRDHLSLVGLAVIKINNILKMDEKDYLKVVWK